MVVRVLLIATAALSFAQSQTVIDRVEPPSWWTNHSVNPVRLMFTGRNLAGAKLSTGSPHLEAERVSVASNGRYAFADLRIAPSAKPGGYKLRLNGASIAFDLLAPLPRTGRFQGFDQDDVIYLIMVDRFANGDTANDDSLVDRTNPRLYHGGDFAGIKQRLGYLKDLGVTTLWLTPIYDNRASYHGYHTIDFYSVDEHFGDVRAFRDLVDAAHGAGLKVIQDQVANHIGPEHEWAALPPTPTWLHGTVERHLRSSSEMWTLVDPFASPALHRPILEGWFVNTLPDLNQDDIEVSRYLIQNSLWWIGSTGIDGIRQDTVPYVDRVFWRKWNAAIQRAYPRLSVVGEVFNADPRVLRFFDDSGFSWLFDFPLYFSARNVFAKRTHRYRELPATLARDPTARVTFLGNHDVRRLRSESPDTQAVKDAFTFQLTTRGIPMIYYGDETGMEGGDDPDNRRDFSQGAPAEPDVFKHVRTLLHLRAKTSALRRGKLVNLAAAGDHYVYARQSDSEIVIVALGKPPEVDTAVLSLQSNVAVADTLGSGHTATVSESILRLSGPGVYVFPRVGSKSK